jgi:hypothetical protein
VIIITDIDHTIADSYWRDPLYGKWEEYYEAGKDDKPIHFVVDMLRVMSLAGHEIIANTGRPERWRFQTNRWLIDNNVPVDKVFMRAEWDHRPSNIVKIEAITSRKIGLDCIGFVLEDRERDAAAYRELGLNVMLVSKGGRPWPSREYIGK